jgi:hypothetical protein
MSAFTLWNAPQACLWIASRDEAQVGGLKERHTFAELAMETEVAWDYVDDPEVLPPVPGWIVTSQIELLGACVRGTINLMGRPSSGGVSENIPGPACATARFFCTHRDRGECLGPPGTPPGVYWTDLQVAAEDVRRIWPADRSADSASSPSIPAIAQLSAADGEQPENFEQKTEQKYAPRRAGAKRFQRGAVLDYLNEQYPDGVPAEVSARSIQTALEAQGKPVSLRTIGRAMGRKPIGRAMGRK